MIPAVISEIRLLSPTTKLFVLDTGDQPLEFRAGQWVDCYAVVEVEPLIGGYSIVSAPHHAERIELAVKRAQTNPMTLFLHERATVGDPLVLDGGQGACYFEAGMARSLMLIAGGIGITPLMSIVRYVADSDPNADVTLIYSATAADELIFRDELTALANASNRMRCVFTTTREARPEYRHGRIDRSLLQELGATRMDLHYVCGPGEMIDSVRSMLLNLGVEEPHIRYERWW